jgi:peptide/nickel transport system ATP-binding protein
VSAARGDETLTDAEPLLRVEDLRVQFPTEDGVVHALDGVSFQVRRGRTLGIVGESGSGKSVAALTVLGLTRSQGARVSGRILFDGRDLVTLPDPQLRAIRGNEIAIVFQDPLSSLHPLYRVGAQLVEAMRAHREITKAQARARAIELLGLVGIPEPARRVDDYPHEFSGGMRQRAMIAMALTCDPKLLIADEPTSALDVTVQAQILALLERLRRELGMTIALITHDLGVVAEMADEIAVLYAGRIVEQGPAERVLTAPQHAHTRELLRSIATLAHPREPEPVSEPLLTVRDLVKRFPVLRGVMLRRHVAAVEAVAGVSFELRRGETLGLVGETGCGKSTIARLITRLLEPTGGEICFQGHDIAHLRGAALKTTRREVQIVFQDPYSSLNPRKTAGAIIGEPFAIHGLHRDKAERTRAVQELMDRVDLRPEHYNRYPHEFSGGQRQRIGVARALALKPKLLIADEPVSALDAQVQAQILELLRELRRDLGLTLLLISHDLSVVRYMADRVAVMREGSFIELAPTEALFSAPQHPYTRELLAAVPGARRSPPPASNGSEESAPN